MKAQQQGLRRTRSQKKDPNASKRVSKVMDLEELNLPIFQDPNVGRIELWRLPTPPSRSRSRVLDLEEGSPHVLLESLVHLHTTTTETISLQQVRAGDSDDVGSNHSGDSDGGRHVTIWPEIHEL